MSVPQCLLDMLKERLKYPSISYGRFIREYWTVYPQREVKHCKRCRACPGGLSLAIQPLPPQPTPPQRFGEAGG